MRIKLRTAGLDDLTSIYAIRRDSILGVPSEASWACWVSFFNPTYRSLLLRTYCQERPRSQQVNGGLGENRLKRVLAYIDAHLAENIGLQDMATVAGLGQHHFSMMFKQSTGISPYSYVINQRIERAKRQLKRNDAAIIDVALACGFADQSHFTKHFRKFVGMTPRAFRAD